jgi:3',5'-cyclic AMP phosphodiesterase CpdA
MALATQQSVSFMQFTGDLINGYRTEPMEMDLQYANWKRVIQPFAHYIPVIATMGNHEALMRVFRSKEYSFSIDRFPYETESAEAVFARNFVNPLNGPESEDGAKYDPNKKKKDFPSYKENVFYYTYDNVAMINMNSDYWYAPSTALIPLVSGGLHGYIMDQQLKWLEETIELLENNENIDHVFVTQHTPCFPNGGHVQDDMWYRGNNDYRPYVAGKPLKKGIIERRDEILDIIINRSSKVRAILTGDEHNYAKTELGPNTIIYDENWDKEKLQLSRTIYQINNGAAGAPYYAQEQTPWTGSVTGFTTQNALVIFNVDGEKIDMVVLNPDTLEHVDELQLR